MTRSAQAWTRVTVDGEAVPYCEALDILGWAKDGCRVVVHGDTNVTKTSVHKAAHSVGCAARTQILAGNRLVVLPPYDPEDWL